jgi:hypothetical protein
VKIVDEWRQAWKWFSVWAMGIPATVAAVWLAIPEQWQAIFLQNVTPKQIVWAVLVILGLGIAGRLVKQDK